MIRKEAWSFCRTISGVSLCLELHEPKGPQGFAARREPCALEGWVLQGLPHGDIHIWISIPVSSFAAPPSSHHAGVPRNLTPKMSYRGTSLMRKRTPLGPYRRPMPRVVGASQGNGCFPMVEVPLYAARNDAPLGVLRRGCFSVQGLLDHKVHQAVGAYSDLCL